MSTFTGKLHYKYRDDGLAEITQPVSFYLGHDLCEFHVQLEIGSLTNFASIPKWMQWLFPADHEDYIMAAAFHDALVGEFGEPIWVMFNGRKSYKPDWQESANWFREMIKVRQKVRRSKRSKWKAALGIVPDVITRWSFWFMVSLHGLLR